MTIKDIQSLVESYIVKLKTAEIPITAVYIFGSAAKGKMRKDSDIDVCVVSSLFGKNRQEERLLLMKLQRGVTDLIEPHPLSPQDFRDKYNPLAREIQRYGIRL